MAKRRGGGSIIASAVPGPCAGGCGTRVQSSRLCLNCWRLWSFGDSDSSALADTTGERSDEP
jgi:hypothetical protein